MRKRGSSKENNDATMNGKEDKAGKISFRTGTGFKTLVNRYYYKRYWWRYTETQLRKDISVTKAALEEINTQTLQEALMKWFSNICQQRYWGTGKSSRLVNQLENWWKYIQNSSKIYIKI